MAERRPIASRNSPLAARAAARLARAGVSPNHISQASIVFAAIAGLALAFMESAGTGMRVACLLIAALGCQLRLICNLLDGMVAVEGGRSEPDGAFWNEAPDRAADLAILVGAGVGLGAPALGFAAGAGAVLTAYIRELGRAEGAPADFSGPMAKPHRMATVTLGALLTAVETATWGSNWGLWAALWLVALGAFLTALRRSARLVAHLRRGSR